MQLHFHFIHKNITSAGEGGALATINKKLAKKLKNYLCMV